MQRRQQGDDKKIAVIKTERPALTLFLTQYVDQLRDIVAQLAERPDTVVKPGDRRIIRTRGI